MDSGASQVITLLESCRAAYEQTYQHLSPVEREQVARYWSSFNSEISNSPPKHLQQGPSKRPAPRANFGDMEPTPKRTGHVCTPTVPFPCFG